MKIPSNLWSLINFASIKKKSLAKEKPPISFEFCCRLNSSNKTFHVMKEKDQPVGSLPHDRIMLNKSLIEDAQLNENDNPMKSTDVSAGIPMRFLSMVT